jgi:hypothetical protein
VAGDIAAFENAPQPSDRCLIQMFPNPSFWRAGLAGSDGLDPAVRPPARTAAGPSLSITASAADNESGVRGTSMLSPLAPGGCAKLH